VKTTFADQYKKNKGEELALRESGGGVGRGGRSTGKKRQSADVVSGKKKKTLSIQS